MRHPAHGRGSVCERVAEGTRSALAEDAIGSVARRDPRRNCSCLRDNVVRAWGGVRLGRSVRPPCARPDAQRDQALRISRYAPNDWMVVCHRLQRITPSAPMGVRYFKGGQDVMLHALDRGRGPRRRRTCSDVLDVGHQRGLVGPIRPMPSRAAQSRRACRHWDLSWRGSRPEAGFHVLLATTTALGVEPSEALRDRMEPMGPTLVLPTKRSACCPVSSSMVCAAGR
jgi:hypothetical protein